MLDQISVSVNEDFTANFVRKVSTAVPLTDTRLSSNGLLLVFIDVDECSMELHECPPNSKCINKPGWYHCQCLDGFTSSVDKSDVHSGGLKCVDINECHIGVDTCNEQQTCVNTEGGYKCQCPSKSWDGSESCSGDCEVNGQTKSHGSKWKSHVDSCFQCSCTFGVTNCTRRECDCSEEEVDYNCCPQCKKSVDCIDQLDASVTYKNGEKWLFQCKSCSCLVSPVTRSISGNSSLSTNYGSLLFSSLRFSSFL